MICWYLYIVHVISTCTAAKTLFVLPDNVSDVNCPSQPCAPLGQYLLDNGSLPVLSNVVYYFLPGEHSIHGGINLMKVHNFSFIGFGSSPAKFVCRSLSYVGVFYSYNVTIRNIEFSQCNGHLFPLIDLKLVTALLLYKCSYCRVEEVKFVGYGFAGIDLCLNSYINNTNINMTIIRPDINMCAPKLALIFLGTTGGHNYHDSVSVNNVITSGYSKVCYDHYVSMSIQLRKGNYSMNVNLQNSQFYNIDQIALTVFIHNTNTLFYIKNCSFMHIKRRGSEDFKKIIDFYISSNSVVINLQHCKFYYNVAYTILDVSFACDNCIHRSNVTIEDCYFINNNGTLLMLSSHRLCKVNVFLNQIVYIANNEGDYLMYFVFVAVYMNSMINVLGNKVKLYIMEFYNSDITVTKTIAFISNTCRAVIYLKSDADVPFIILLDYANIKFINISSYHQVIVDNDNNNNIIIPYCVFQYTMSSNDRHNISEVLRHYSISFSGSQDYTQEAPHNSYISNHDSFNDFLTHCKWLPTAVFNGYNPEYINQQIIQVDGHQWAHYKEICYCPYDGNYNCTIDLLGSVYPGQVSQIDLCMPQADRSYIMYVASSACKVAHQSEIAIIGNHSKTFNFSIISEGYERCEVFLTTHLSFRTAFYVQLSACPVGFTLQNGICDCDPSLPPDIDTCYIDLSAIRRPPNTWVTAHILTNGTIHYLISDCPMDYCIPYSTNFNLVQPDLQCQFNRTGMLCSQCQHHLSMVFASSRCMKCTNVHILITIIVIVAGIILVVLLYVLNLTVTNGTINGIIFYANIISINDSIFLVNDNVFKALRVFISFTNLDLGIETCFYDGMDSYTKMWLQLLFPIYLITIAVSIIIASRYSSRILRLTYSRSLPVLGTLFLLSYTGILRVVSIVLFSYSTIRHYPSGDKQIVWSVDASTPLFGLKFIALFITCLLLFLLLISFNIIMLFSRYLSRFKVINHFKPLLDAFQGSYKDKYYYWVAVQIMFRSIFFSLRIFQLNLRLVLANLMLVTFTSYYGYLQPNKLNIVNFQEVLMLINVTIMYVVSIQDDEEIFSVITNMMMSLALIQFTIIMLSHFLVYTCQCNFDIKEKLTMIFNKKKPNRSSFDVALLIIPECMHDYKEYQDGLVSDDFNYQN